MRISRFEFEEELLRDGELTERGFEEVKKLLYLGGYNPIPEELVGLKFTNSIGFPLKRHMIFVYDHEILTIET